MNALLNVTWQAMPAPLWGLLVVLMLLLIVYVQVWRHRIHRLVRSTLHPKRDMRLEMESEDLVQEYLANADFSNEGNPNVGWKTRFHERSSPTERCRSHPTGGHGRFRSATLRSQTAPPGGGPLDVNRLNCRYGQG